MSCSRDPQRLSTDEFLLLCCGRHLRPSPPAPSPSGPPALGHATLCHRAWGAATTFGLELQTLNGDLWTPSVLGETLNLETHVPAPLAARSGYGLRELVEILDPAVGKASARMVCTNAELAAAPPGQDRARLPATKSVLQAAGGYSSRP
jgi:hypothetical protein